MEARSAGSHVIDACARCEGVFLDPGEGRAFGLDVEALLATAGFAPGGPLHSCPDHHQPMQRFMAGAPRLRVEVERATCCGGIFALAAGLSELTAASAATVSASPPPAQTAIASATQDTGSAAAPRTAAARACPVCRAPMRGVVDEGVALDDCSACTVRYFEPGEPERAGIDTQALFAPEPWGATHLGASGFACPQCAAPMEHYQVELLGTRFELHFHPRCGGLLLERTRQELTQRVSRRAVQERADQEYERGERITRSGASLPPSVLEGRDEARTARELVQWAGRPREPRSTRRLTVFDAIFGHGVDDDDGW